jgi:hypothetical protein
MLRSVGVTLFATIALIVFANVHSLATANIHPISILFTASKPNYEVASTAEVKSIAGSAMKVVAVGF